ncbi:MAG: DUF58 domain-containing protein [Elusimicrobia bacterium]|nr:DUF58 domain-containing protein [Elusimicrobiota bacterium]
MRILDALALAKLNNLRLDLRRHRVDGAFSGRHRSAHFGFSQEFAHHRQYAPGDEIKFLDWKVYARKDRFFVKQFQEDKSLQTYLLVDASGSMGYRGAGPSPKWDYARALAMAMGYLVMRQDDAVGLVTFDSKTRAMLPASRKLTHLELMDKSLVEAKPGGDTDLAAVLRAAAGAISRRALIILISDLLGDSKSILETVQVLRARKNEVFVMQVLDPMERDLSLEGPVRFEGLEEAEPLRCEVELVREAYREEFDKQERMYRGGFHGAAVPYGVFYTDVPWDVMLPGFLSLCSRF